MELAQLGQKVKQKYPDYADMDDAELGQKTLSRYPEYQDLVEQPAIAPAGSPGVGSTPPAPSPSLNQDVSREAMQPPQRRGFSMNPYTAMGQPFASEKAQDFISDVPENLMLGGVVRPMQSMVGDVGNIAQATQQGLQNTQMSPPVTPEQAFQTGVAQAVGSKPVVEGLQQSQEYLQNKDAELYSQLKDPESIGAKTLRGLSGVPLAIPQYLAGTVPAAVAGFSEEITKDEPGETGLEKVKRAGKGALQRGGERAMLGAALKVSSALKQPYRSAAMATVFGGPDVLRGKYEDAISKAIVGGILSGTHKGKYGPKDAERKVKSVIQGIKNRNLEPTAAQMEQLVEFVKQNPTATTGEMLDQFKDVKHIIDEQPPTQRPVESGYRTPEAPRKQPLPAEPVQTPQQQAEAYLERVGGFEKTDSGLTPVIEKTPLEKQQSDLIEQSKYVRENIETKPEQKPAEQELPDRGYDQMWSELEVSRKVSLDKKHQGGRGRVDPDTGEITYPGSKDSPTFNPNITGKKAGSKSNIYPEWVRDVQADMSEGKKSKIPFKSIVNAMEKFMGGEKLSKQQKKIVDAITERAYDFDPDFQGSRTKIEESMRPDYVNLEKLSDADLARKIGEFRELPGFEAEIKKYEDEQIRRRDKADAEYSGPEDPFEVREQKSFFGEPEAGSTEKSTTAAEPFSLKTEIAKRSTSTKGYPARPKDKQRTLGDAIAKERWNKANRADQGVRAEAEDLVASESRIEVQKKLQNIFGDYAILDRIFEGEIEPSQLQQRKFEAANEWMADLESAAVGRDYPETHALLGRAYDYIYGGKKNTRDQIYAEELKQAKADREEYDSLRDERYPPGTTFFEKDTIPASAKKETPPEAKEPTVEYKPTDLKNLTKSLLKPLKNERGAIGSKGTSERDKFFKTMQAVEKLAKNKGTTLEAELDLPPNIKKQAIRIYRENTAKGQDAVELVKANIDFKSKGVQTKITDKITSAQLKFRRAWTDAFAVIEHAEKEMRGVKKLDPNKMDPSKSPYMAARESAKTATMRANQAVLHGTFDFAGNTTGISLREALRPVAGNIQDFITYAYARRATDLWARDVIGEKRATELRMKEVESLEKRIEHAKETGDPKDVKKLERKLEKLEDTPLKEYKPINPGISKEIASETVKHLETPERMRALDEVTKFEDRIFDYLVEAGGLSKEGKEQIRALNPIHIPLQRVVDKYGVGIGKNIGDVKSPIHKIVGSEKQISEPLQAIISQTAEIMGAADKIRVGRLIVEAAEGNPVGSKWVQKRDTKALKGDLEKMLEDAGMEMSEADLGRITALFRNAEGKENRITFWRDGKQEVYDVAPELYTTLKAMDEVSLHPMVDMFFGKPARAVRMGATGLRPGFSLITNPIRDGMTFALQSEYTKSYLAPYTIGKGLVRRLGPENVYGQMYRRSGVDLSNLIGLDKQGLKQAAWSVLSSSKKAKALNVVKHPVEALKEIFSISEAGPRMAEFEAAYKKGAEKYGKGSAGARVLASNASSDVTIDFRKAGVYAAALNRVIPFFNVAIQSPIKMAQYAKAHPGKAAIKGVAGMTVPTYMLWQMNKDEKWYKELPEWQKAIFFNMKIGDEIVRIPKPFEWGMVFSSGPEAIWNYMYTKDKVAFKKAGKKMLDVVSPDIWPAGIKPIIETTANWDYFREKPIVPYYSAKYKPPEEQYKNYTTNTMRAIGGVLGYSPAKLDHLLTGYTGGLGTDMLRGVESFFADEQKKKGQGKAGIPVVGRLFTRKKTPQQRADSMEWGRKETMQQIRSRMKYKKPKEMREIIKHWNTRYPGNKIKSWEISKMKSSIAKQEILDRVKARRKK